MPAKIRYTNEPFGDVEVVKDFLPSPDALVFREDSVKVTLSLSKRSVEFFKREAGKRNTPYQRMIRRLLDAYADRIDATTGATAARGEGRAARERKGHA